VVLCGFMATAREDRAGRLRRFGWGGRQVVRQIPDMARLPNEIVLPGVVAWNRSSVITTVPGAAASCTRAARLGASPNTSASLLAPTLTTRGSPENAVDRCLLGG
jgi:hypothetical protein